MPSLLIVGAGVFGLSTARAACESYEVKLVDDGYPDTASRGPGRIFRSEYPCDHYTSLANESQLLWKEDPYFHPHPRQVQNPDRSMKEDQTSAQLDADLIMQRELNKAIAEGVTYIKDTVCRLQWEGEQCVGVVTVKGQKIQADSVVLALGPSLPAFLASERRPISDICIPITVAWMGVQLDDEECKRLKSEPIKVIPGHGEHLRPNGDNMIWVNNARSASVSDVAAVRGHSTTSKSPFYRETSDLFNEVLPSLKQKPQDSRSLYYCLDAITHTQDFIISPVPNSTRLFIAGGGSCHAYKFYRILGKKILSVVEGIESELARIWHVETHREAKNTDRQVHGELWPTREFPESELNKNTPS